jgi:hypothetical protein
MATTYKITVDSEGRERMEEALRQCVPHARVHLSTLGGKGNESLMILVCFDPKESWANGILENSRYSRFHLCSDRELELFSGGLKRELGVGFRKTKAKSVDDATDRIRDYISKVRLAESAKKAETATV